MIKKPIKPKKPKVTDSPPTKIITISKVLFKDRNGKFVMYDNKNNPELFQGPEYPEYPDWDKLVSLGLDWGSLEVLSYYDYQQIAKDCELIGNFEIVHRRDHDGCYIYSSIEYQINDTDYQQKLDVYNNRFKIYNEKLKEYEESLCKYNELKKDERKRKLQEQLSKL